MNIVKLLAVFGGSCLSVGALILMVVMKTPKQQDDKAAELAWTLLSVGILMCTGAYVIDHEGGLTLP